jgi:hypothetical protein
MWLVFSLVTGLVVVAVPFFLVAFVGIIGECIAMFGRPLGIGFAFPLLLILTVIFSASIAVSRWMERHRPARVYPLSAKEPPDAIADSRKGGV